jgi:hypothetical protein
VQFIVHPESSMTKLTYLPVLGGIVFSWLGSIIAGVLTQDMWVNLIVSTVFGLVGVYVGYVLYKQWS